MTTTIKICVVGIALLVACEPSPPLPAPIPACMPACETAQRRLEQLGCPEAESEAGHSFAAVCTDMADAGVDLHPSCVAQITDCSQVGAASRGCP